MSIQVLGGVLEKDMQMCFDLNSGDLEPRMYKRT